MKVKQRNSLWKQIQDLSFFTEFFSIRPITLYIKYS